ncbi:PspA/IM30 family protein [Ralstonia pseudosolanacearum]|uniref:PspA/IM30 family protein n=1 Tax=Ralstonia pseudosolanacearum TaxID=1310165 RepID=UPI0027075EF2|nr:PspA/IM30 family protein [Ralstonia pseudosolanacearum]MDO3615373.1 PspA/IM30 family protein [Ralstonia pseudosolanacearum]
MSILDRIGRILAGTANDAIDKLAEPGRDARQIVRELEDQIEKANSSLLDAEAEHEVLRGKLDKADADAAKWQGSAERAMAAGDEGLARECLVKVEEAETVAKGYAATVENFEKTLTDLRARIQDLKHRKDNYAQRTDLIEARSHVARAQETAAAAIGDVGSTRNLATDFNKLEDGVLKQEARAAAATRIADQDSGKSLQDRVDALGKATSIEDRMAALKKKVGT